jgi:hypothetical protein
VVGDSSPTLLSIHDIEVLRGTGQPFCGSSIDGDLANVFVLIRLMDGLRKEDHSGEGCSFLLHHIKGTCQLSVESPACDPSYSGDRGRKISVQARPGKS